MFVSFSLKSLRLSMQMLGGSKRGQGMGTDHCSKSSKFSIYTFSSLALSKLCSGCGLFDSLTARWQYPGVTKSRFQRCLQVSTSRSYAFLSIHDSVASGLIYL